MRYVIAATIALSASLAAQNPPPEPRFDVVSIKRNTSGSSGMSAGSRPDGSWGMANGSVISLIYSAFTIKNREIVGLPDWATTERYDVIATVVGRPSREQETAMLRGLLAERLNFRGHVEQREIPVFTLTVARPERPLPPTLIHLPVDCAAVDAARRRGEALPAPPLADGSAPCGYSMRGGAEMVITSRGMTMERLADTLGSAAGRVVIDRTGLKGDYAFTLTYDLPRTGGGNADTPTVFTALQEQLGLKLEAARAPVDTLVIDHIERPSEN